MAIVTTDSKHYGDIANAIRNKKGNVNAYKPADMAEAIMTIEGGDTPAPVQAKDVNFYDYDGTLLYSYTVAEAQALTELPPLPTQQGLICKEWNYTLASVQATTHKLDVGATYITDDGKTRLYIYLPDNGRLSVPLYFSQTVANGVIIDWGDGSESETLAGTGNRNATHDYATKGYYTITLEVVGECILGLGNGDFSTTAIGGDTQGYKNTLYKAEVGNGVTSIGDFAFGACYSLQTITIPNGVTSIDSNVFGGCYNLQTITIPNGVTSIDEGVFVGCYNLQTITIPNSVTSIGVNAFYSCHSLQAITIPNSVTSIGVNAFYVCYSLQAITIPNSVTSIDSNAFYSCYNLQTITIPNSVTSIDSNAFYSCYSLQTITIPNSVTGIGVNAFRDCHFVKDYYFYPTTPPTLANTGAFTGIPSDCVMHVPNESVNLYKTATNWITYADYIYPMEGG